MRVDESEGGEHTLCPDRFQGQLLERVTALRGEDAVQPGDSGDDGDDDGGVPPPPEPSSTSSDPLAGITGMDRRWLYHPTSVVEVTPSSTETLGYKTNAVGVLMHECEPSTVVAGGLIGTPSAFSVHAPRR